MGLRAEYEASYGVYSKHLGTVESGKESTLLPADTNGRPTELGDVTTVATTAIEKVPATKKATAKMTAMSRTQQPAGVKSHTHIPADETAPTEVTPVKPEPTILEAASQVLESSEEQPDEPTVLPKPALPAPARMRKELEIADADREVLGAHAMAVISFVHSGEQVPFDVATDFKKDSELFRTSNAIARLTLANLINRASTDRFIYDDGFMALSSHVDEVARTSVD